MHKGERKEVQFTLSPQQLMLVNDKDKLYQPEGRLMLSVGGGQPGVNLPQVAAPLFKTIIIKR